MKNIAKDRVKKVRRRMLLPLAVIVLAAIGSLGFWFGLGEKEISVPPVTWNKVVPLQETQDIILYFGDARTMRLVPEHRDMPLRDGPVETAIALIEALTTGPKNGATPTLPSGTRVKALYVTADGTAVVDFSREITANHPGGVNAEMVTIFSIVKTLTQNIPQIKRVKLLVEGSEIETLAGHVDCLRPFSVVPTWIEGSS
jgi:spore germination protein GerM